MHNDDDAYAAAITAFQVEPESLTQDQINVLKSVDEALGTRAATKRADAIVKAAEARHRAALGQPPLKTKGYNPEEWASGIVDTITVALAHPRRRIKALEALNADAERRLETLEQRVLELEAALAALAVPHVDH